MCMENILLTFSKFFSFNPMHLKNNSVSPEYQAWRELNAVSCVLQGVRMAEALNVNLSLIFIVIDSLHYTLTTEFTLLFINHSRSKTVLRTSSIQHLAFMQQNQIQKTLETLPLLIEFWSFALFLSSQSALLSNTSIISCYPFLVLCKQDCWHPPAMLQASPPLSFFLLAFCLLFLYFCTAFQLL